MSNIQNADILVPARVLSSNEVDLLRYST